MIRKAPNAAHGLRAIVLAAGAVALGCASDAEPGPDEDDCALVATLTGALDMSFSGAVYCAGWGVYPAGPADMSSLSELRGSRKMSIAVYGVQEGQTGTFDAAVGFVNQPHGPHYATPQRACSLQITHWRLIHDYGEWRHYQYAASGQCAVPADGIDGATGSVSIGDFSVKAGVGRQ